MREREREREREKERERKRNACFSPAFHKNSLEFFQFKQTLNSKNPRTFSFERVTAPASIEFPPPLRTHTRAKTHKRAPEGELFLSTVTTTENTRERLFSFCFGRRRRRRKRRRRRRKNERVASGPEDDGSDDDDGDEEEDLVSGFDDDRFVVFIQSPRERGGGVECAWSSSSSSPSSSFGTRRIARRREADKTKRDEPRKVGAAAKTTGCEL